MVALGLRKLADAHREGEGFREGVPLNEIQQALGHSNAATTSRYLAHVAPEQLLTTLRNRQWLPSGEPQ